MFEHEVLCNHFYQRFMAERKYLVIVYAKDIEFLKATIEKIIEKVDQLLNDRLENADTYLTNEEATKLLKVSSRTLFKWRQEGVLKCSQIGRKVYFKNKDVQALIERNTLNRYQLR